MLPPLPPQPTVKGYPHLLGYAVALLLGVSACNAIAEPDRCQLSYPQPTPLSPHEGGTAISAQRLQVDSVAGISLQGDVEIYTGSTDLYADKVQYQPQQGRYTLEGGVRFISPQLQVESESASYDEQQQHGTFEAARFTLPRQQARGAASHITQTPEQTALQGVRYTTCPDSPPAWELVAPELQLDSANNRGEVRHLNFQIYGVPVLYLPWLSFPLQGRASGLLPPSYRHSEHNGYDLTLPWYWNIAPHQDATLSPRLIEKRGALLATEYRYLGEQSQAELQIDYLPHDQLLNSQRRHASHLSYSFQSPATPSYWYSRVDYAALSDSDYLDQVGSDTLPSSETRLPQLMELGWRSDTLALMLRAQRYYELSSDESYQRLPQLHLQWQPHTVGLRTGLELDLTRFHHSDSTKPIGDRLVMRPSIGYPLEAASGFVRPTLALSHSQYQLDGESSSLSRSQPILTIDSGLFFQRRITESASSGPLIQTLEPRLMLLYVPQRQQSQLPLFDSTPLQRSWEQLFHPNRYSGSDRQSDHQQLTLALSSRMIDTDSGIERLRLRAGRAFQLHEPVTLENSSWEQSPFDDIVTDITLRPFATLAMQHIHYLTAKGESSGQQSYIEWTPPAGRITLAHTEEPSLNERQGELQANLHLSSSWQAIGRWHYSLAQEQTLEAILGAEYHSCCWSLRVVAKDAWREASQQLDRSWLLTLELKGLGSIGETLDEGLERGILSAP